MATLGWRGRHIRARLLGSPNILFVRPAAGATTPVAGEIFDLEVAETLRDGPRRWLQGVISRVRLDPEALALEPLALVELGPRGTERHDDATPPLQAPAEALDDRRPPARGEYELERLPAGPAGAEPVLHRAIDLWAADRPRAARKLVERLLRADLRCLAAHACLGFFAFCGAAGLGGPARARRHYAAGLAIGGLSLPADFDGELPWSLTGNRAFLRCLYGHSICLWREGEPAAAREGFRRLCRLSPGDQLAARLALDHLERAWETGVERRD